MDTKKIEEFLKTEEMELLGRFQMDELEERLEMQAKWGLWMEYPQEEPTTNV